MLRNIPNKIDQVSPTLVNGAAWHLTCLDYAQGDR